VHLYELLKEHVKAQVMETLMGALTVVLLVSWMDLKMAK